MTQPNGEPAGCVIAIAVCGLFPICDPQSVIESRVCVISGERAIARGSSRIQRSEAFDHCESLRALTGLRELAQPLRRARRE
jgi:hypothetical protein